MHTYSVSLTPPIYACVSYLSAMMLLFLDLQGALFHSPLELKISVNSIQSQKHLGISLPTAGSQTWARSENFENFFRKSGDRTRAHGDESNPLEISMSSAIKGEPGLATGLTTGRFTLSFVHDSPVTETCVKQEPGPHLLTTALPRE
jgi:hypothetical protein